MAGVTRVSRCELNRLYDFVLHFLRSSVVEITSCVYTKTIVLLETSVNSGGILTSFSKNC